jgi:hypothetical protein
VLFGGEGDLGWKYESSILYDSRLFEYVAHGKEDLLIAAKPLRGLFWVRLRLRCSPTRTWLFCTAHLPWMGSEAEISTGVCLKRVFIRARIV